MKKVTSFIILFIFFFSLIGTQLYAQTKKIALIVAVGKYPKEGGWPSISSDKDVPLITNALKSQGFADIALIQDDKADKAGIIKAIQDLTIKAVAGDIVVFHFSGHGQQIKDDNGDEKDDGYDEAIVPYDARMRYETGVYEGEKHLRDDELDVLFTQLREKLGAKGNLLVILDACHSGTATRGMSKSRGTIEKMAPEGYKPNETNVENGMMTTENTTSAVSRGATKTLSSMVVLSGASPDQLNYETKDEQGNFVGSLSYAFSRAVRKADKETTYRALFNNIKVDMSVLAPNQIPQIEGSMDVTIFGGQVVEQKPYFTVSKWITENEILINAGSIFGVFTNTTVELFPAGTIDPSKSTPFAKGIVTTSDNFTSTIKTDVSVPKANIQNYWIFIKEQTYGDLLINVGLDIKNADLENLVKQNLSKVSYIKLVNENPDVVVEYGNKYTRGTNIQVSTSTDIILYDKNYSNTASSVVLEEVVNSIKSFAQGSLLRNLEISSGDHEVKFEFIPITVNADQTEKERFDLKTKTDNSNTIVFRDGDYFKLRISNYGTKRLYYSLIDIQPDNQVNLLIPVYDSKRQIRIPATDFKIDQGASIELDYTFFFGPPYGNEIFKLIATEQPLNLEPIILSKGTGSRGSQNPLEMLLSDSYGNGNNSRGGGVGYTPGIPQGTANTYTVIFKIEK